MKNNTLHISIAAVLVALLILLTDPFMLWMPPMAAMTVLVGTAVLLCVWAGFIMREGAADEREALHRTQAGRAAYLAAIGVLTIGLVWQGFVLHHIDPWIALALGSVILVKLGSALYLQRYH